MHNRLLVFLKHVRLWLDLVTHNKMLIHVECLFDGNKFTNQFSVDFWTSCFHWTMPVQQNASTCCTASPGRCYIKKSESYNHIMLFIFGPQLSVRRDENVPGFVKKKLCQVWNHTIKDQGKQLQASEGAEGAEGGLLGNINMCNITFFSSSLWRVTSDWCHTSDLKL